MRSQSTPQKCGVKIWHKISRGDSGFERDFPEGYERPQGIRCLRRPRSTARRNLDQAVLRVAPGICTRAARAAADSAAMHKRSRTRVQPGEHLGHPRNTVSLKQLSATETPPRGVRSLGSYRDPQSSRWTSASNETGGALS